MRHRWVPLVVGGTGLYLRGLLRGVIEAPGRDEALRERLRREKGVTFLVATHDRELAAGLPRQVTVRDGHLLETATVAA